MKDRFLQWNKDNKILLAELGIAIDYVLVPDEVSNDSFIYIDYLTKSCLGRVSLWEKGNVDVEILDIDSEKTLLFENYQCDIQIDFWQLLSNFFKVLRGGQ